MVVVERMPAFTEASAAVQPDVVIHWGPATKAPLQTNVATQVRPAPIAAQMPDPVGAGIRCVRSPIGETATPQPARRVVANTLRTTTFVCPDETPISVAQAVKPASPAQATS